MATPQLVTIRDFNTSRYAQLVEDIETPLGDILSRAEAAVQSRIGFSLVPTEYTETWVARAQTLFVRHRPITSITSVRRRGNPLFAWELIDVGYYRFESEPGYIEVTKDVIGFEVEVVYEAGIVTLPEDVREAILMQAVLFAVQDFEVYGSGDSRQPGYVKYIREEVEMILSQYDQTATVWH